MTNVTPFIRYVNLSHKTEPDALVGFALPYLPDMLTSRWLSSVDPQQRLVEALHLQTRLISNFWHMHGTAWDLRFVATDDIPGIAIGLLCRIHHFPHNDKRRFQHHCLSIAQQTAQLFADYGYELSPLGDERSLSRYLTPFPFQAVGEIRKTEELPSFADAYTVYEVYVPYPWQWSVQTRLRLCEALLYRQSNCLISVNLEPTHLTQQEHQHLKRATSSRLQDLLHNTTGSNGPEAYQVYMDYTHTLQQPYLLRISIAAATSQTLTHIGRIFTDELHTHQSTHKGSRVPTLCYPQNQQEWQWACSSIANTTCIPWGENLGMELPGTARLRYLVDEKMASMAFRLPVAKDSDIPGIPVRSLTPLVGTSPTSGTATRRSTTSPAMSTTPATPTTVSQINSNFAGTTSTQLASFNRPTPATDKPASHSFTIQRPEDLIGKTLGNCQIEALLGQGGFGAVYRARQNHLNRIVAIKVILAPPASDDYQKQRTLQLRFEREAQAVARLDHPHILTLYEYQTTPFPYMVMPYMAGGSLADELKASGQRPLPLTGVATILQQVAPALDTAHRHHLVHRDIKPHNLLRHADGRILLSDFGIVQFEDEDYTALTANTKPSPYTPSYASPEQHQWYPVDYHTDIYSLGIVIYELLCGHRPFSQPYQHVSSPLPPLQSFSVQVPSAVDAVLAKALAKQPDQRYSSAGEMAADFQAACRS